MESKVSIGFFRHSDSSESYKEQNVPLSEVCNLTGTRSVNVNKSFSHKIEVAIKSVITVIKNTNTGYWHMVDDNGNYDPKWYLNDAMTLENVKLYQGLVIRGTLKEVSHQSTKYCKELTSNQDKFFTKDNIPVMTAKYVIIGNRGSVYGRGVK